MVCQSHHRQSNSLLLTQEHGDHVWSEEKQKGLGWEKNRSRRRKLCFERTAAFCSALCFVISPWTFPLPEISLESFCPKNQSFVTPNLLGHFLGLDFTFQPHLVTLEVFYLEAVLLALAFVFFSISADFVKFSFIFFLPLSSPLLSLSHTERQRETEIISGHNFLFSLVVLERESHFANRKRLQIGEVENMQRLLACFAKCI